MPALGHGHVYILTVQAKRVSRYPPSVLCSGSGTRCARAPIAPVLDRRYERRAGIQLAFSTGAEPSSVCALSNDSETRSDAGVCMRRHGVIVAPARPRPHRADPDARGAPPRRVAPPGRRGAADSVGHLPIARQDGCHARPLHIAAAQEGDVAAQVVHQPADLGRAHPTARSGGVGRMVKRPALWARPARAGTGGASRISSRAWFCATGRPATPAGPAARLTRSDVEDGWSGWRRRAGTCARTSRGSAGTALTRVTRPARLVGAARGRDGVSAAGRGHHWRAGARSQGREHRARPDYRPRPAGRPQGWRAWQAWVDQEREAPRCASRRW